MHKILYIFIIILCLLLLAPNTIPQYNTDETLDKYRQAIAENKNYRTFSFEIGVAGVYPLLKDKDGYAWYTLRYYSDRNKPNDYCMFNGAEFKNMTGHFPKAERDSLYGSDFSQYWKDLYLFGKHYLYKWEGYKFTKYKFPDNDIIVSYKVIGKKVLCIGRVGYGLLDNDKWYYYGNVKLGIKQLGDIVASQMLSLSGVISNKSFKFPNGSFNLFCFNSGNKLYHLKYQAVDTTKEKRIWRNDLYLKRYSKGGVDSLFVVNAQTLNEVDTGYLHPININTITDELFLIYLPGTSLIYSVKNGTIKQVNLGLPLGSTIQLITQLHSGDTWVSYVYNEKIYISSMDLEKVAVGHPFFVSNNETSRNKIFNVIIGKDSFSFATQDPMTAETETFYVFNEQTNTIDKINVPDLAHTYGNERIIKNGKMIYSRRDKEVSDLHKIIIYDPQTAQQDSLSLIDVAASVDVVDYDPDSGFVLVKGIDQFKRIPLSQMIDKEKSFLQKYDNCISLQMKGYNLIINSVSKYSLVGNSIVGLNQQPKLVLMKHEGKHISQVAEINDASFSAVDKQNEVLYLSIGSKRYSFDLRNKELKIIHDYDVPTSMSTWHGRYLCMDEKLNYLEVEDGVKKESSFQPIKALLDSTLKGTGISIKELLNQQYYSPQYISNDVVFFPALVCSYTYKHDLDKIVSGSQGMPEKETEKELENRSTFPRKAQIIGEIGKKFSVQIPAMLYNLRTNDYVMKPEYLFVRSFQKPDRTDIYTAHRYYYKGESYVRISKFEEGKLKLSKSDLMIRINDKDIFDVDLFNQKSGFICRYKKQLYYYQNGWKGINGENFNSKDLSYIIDVQWYKDDIWIVYEDCLVRYSIPLKRSFNIDSQNGLPQRLSRFYTSNDDKPYLLANDGIYSINMESSVNLHIPWFYANDIRLSAAKPATLNPRQNNIKIPIDIINVLYPEQKSLSYRLLGFEDNWKVREYTPYLEYPKLPAGKYEFQVKAISPIGAVSKVNSIKFEIKAPFYSTWWAYLIYVLMGSAAIYGIFKLRTRQLQRRNLALERMVELRTSELKERQQRIQESIEYASLIQKSILPQREELIQRFRQHFVIWKPRDIVGGDFYWLYVNEAGETFFAVIDCTGHGVPGALLSMTVNSLLDKLVKDGGVYSPAEILTRMHREIGAALHQTEAQTQQDGIEIALIKINPSSQTLTFSGGGLHLLHYDPESKVTSHLRGNKHGLGGLKWHAELVFEEQVIPYAEKQRIYLYTDGILDQPVAEAEKLKRLGSVAWLEFLGSIAGLPMEEQETNCNELISRMLACHEQRDDITVVGIEL